MGRCHEFGLQIHDGCGHPMVAGESTCACSECGVVCGGRFAGCPDVWARGPQPVTITETHVDPAPRTVPVNGNGRHRGGSRAQALVVASGEPEAKAPDRSATASSTALRWLESAFEGLHHELQAVRATLDEHQAVAAELLEGMARQEAMLSDLLAASEGNIRLKTVAQSLPGLVGMSVTRAIEASEARAAESRTATGPVIDARLENLVERLEKVVTEAVRVATQATETAAAGPATEAGRTTTKAEAAPARQPEKAVRTSSQASRPSRRSLGS